MRIARNKYLAPTSRMTMELALKHVNNSASTSHYVEDMGGQALYEMWEEVFVMRNPDYDVHETAYQAQKLLSAKIPEVSPVPTDAALDKEF